MKSTVIKFTKGKENLNAMLNQHRCEFNREGLRYGCENKEHVKKGLYHVTSKETVTRVSPFTKCSYYNRSGHYIQFCRAKYGNCKGKMAWTPKGTVPQMIEPIRPNQYQTIKKRVKQP